MIQPDAAAAFLCNDTLRDQGLLSRVLVAAPASLSGTRLYKEPHPNDIAAINAYGARVLSILEAELALMPGKRNELDPRALPLRQRPRQYGETSMIISRRNAAPIVRSHSFGTSPRRRPNMLQGSLVSSPSSKTWKRARLAWKPCSTQSHLRTGM